MLGITRRSASWHWTAVGKHPAVADYFQLSGGSALIDALGAWVSKGYQALLNDGTQPHGHYSWRFWLRGGDSRTLICGLICDSSDRIGRPFPLILTGEGRIKGWEKYWCLLCRDLDATWGELEYLAAHRYEDIKALADALHRIAAPKLTAIDPRGAVDDEGQVRLEAMIPLEGEQGHGRSVFGLGRDQRDPAALASTIFRRHFSFGANEMPRAVFFGGPPQQAYLAVLRHPLSSADFAALWRL